MRKNAFDYVLRDLDVEEIWVLQVISELKGLVVADFERVLGDTGIRFGESSLRKLEWWGLIAQDIHGAWHCTWIGQGVNNWRTQVQLADPDEPIPEPKDGENGDQTGPRCSEYRALFFLPGYCWCCRHRFEHSSEVVLAAVRIVAQAQRKEDGSKGSV